MFEFNHNDHPRNDRTCSNIQYQASKSNTIVKMADYYYTVIIQGELRISTVSNETGLQTYCVSLFSRMKEFKHSSVC